MKDCRNKFKYFVALLSFIFLANQVTAEGNIFSKENLKNFYDKNCSFYLEPSFTVRAGVQNEYVFVKNSADETKKLSELNWQQLPVFFAGAKAEASVYNAGISFNFQEAIPSKCGIVADSDWYNTIERAESYYVPLSNQQNPEISSIKSNYSESDCILQNYYKWLLEIFYNFHYNGSQIKPFFQIDYSYSHFAAKGGYMQYGSYDFLNQHYKSYETAEKIPFDNKNVLELERSATTYWTGLSVSKPFSKLIDFNFSFALSPYAEMDSLDYHPERNYYFLDKLNTFLTGIKFSSDLKFNFTNHQFLKLSLIYEQMVNLYGKTYTRYGANGTFGLLSSSTAGADYHWADFSISYRYIF